MAEGVPAKTLAVLLDMDETGSPAGWRPKALSSGPGATKYLLAPSVRNYVRHLRESRPGGKATS